MTFAITALIPGVCYSALAKADVAEGAQRRLLLD